MADKDYLHGLVHRLYNTMTGNVDAPSAPPKPAYTALGGASRQAANTIAAQPATLEQQIKDSGG